MTLSLLERRRIEAEFAKAILDELEADLGHARAVEILAKTAVRLAETAGRDFAARAGDGRGGLLAYSKILALWSQGGALEVDLKRREDHRLEFDVTRCRYAEMYRELGIPELGRVLSCNRDGAFCQGFNPSIRLTRTRTIMEGAAHCDFRYETKGADGGWLTSLRGLAQKLIRRKEPGGGRAKAEGSSRRESG